MRRAPFAAPSRDRDALLSFLLDALLRRRKVALSPAPASGARVEPPPPFAAVGVARAVRAARALEAAVAATAAVSARSGADILPAGLSPAALAALCGSTASAALGVPKLSVVHFLTRARRGWSAIRPAVRPAVRAPMSASEPTPAATPPRLSALTPLPVQARGGRCARRCWVGGSKVRERSRNARAAARAGT